MTYLGREGYSATAAEFEALPDYRDAMKAHGIYSVPPGRYRYEHRVGIWQVVDVAKNPIDKWNTENYSAVQIVRDQIQTPLDEQFHFQKY